MNALQEPNDGTGWRIKALQPWLIAAAGLGGTLLVGLGLFAPLVALPVIGSLRFVETALGGRMLAWWCVGALGLASACLPWCKRQPLLQLLTSVVTFGALGVIGGSCLAIYRLALLRVAEMSEGALGTMDEGIAKLLEQMRIGSGAWFLVAGAALLLAAGAVSRWARA